MTNFQNELKRSFLESSELIKNLVSQIDKINDVIENINNCIKQGNKIILFGNGGSAADAQHIAAEFIGRFSKERRSIPAISLTTDTSVLTALGNDYSYDVIFSRQCESLVKKGDVVIGISTSGNSINVKNGLIESKKKDAITIALLGNNGGLIKEIVDIAIIVDSNSTPKIQEAHRVIYHLICEYVEKNIN